MDNFDENKNNYESASENQDNQMREITDFSPFYEKKETPRFYRLAASIAVSFIAVVLLIMIFQTFRSHIKIPDSSYSVTESVAAQSGESSVQSQENEQDKTDNITLRDYCPTLNDFIDTLESEGISIYNFQCNDAVNNEKVALWYTGNSNSAGSVIAHIDSKGKVYHVEVDNDERPLLLFLNRIPGAITDAKIILEKFFKNMDKTDYNNDNYDLNITELKSKFTENGIEYYYYARISDYSNSYWYAECSEKIIKPEEYPNYSPNNSKDANVSESSVNGNANSSTDTKPTGSTSNIQNTNPCANGHNWSNATCTSPATCSICGKTSGKPLEHNIFMSKCTACGQVDYSRIAGIYTNVGGFFSESSEDIGISSFTISNSGIVSFSVKGGNYYFKIVEKSSDYAWESTFECYSSDGTKEPDVTARANLDSSGTLLIFHLEWNCFDGQNLYFNGEKAYK